MFNLMQATDIADLRQDLETKVHHIETCEMELMRKVCIFHSFILFTMTVAAV